jgi:hypothetical protein
VLALSTRSGPEPRILVVLAVLVVGLAGVAWLVWAFLLEPGRPSGIVAEGRDRWTLVAPRWVGPGFLLHERLVTRSGSFSRLSHVAPDPAERCAAFTGRLEILGPLGDELWITRGGAPPSTLSWPDLRPRADWDGLVERYPALADVSRVRVLPEAGVLSAQRSDGRWVRVDPGSGRTEERPPTREPRDREPFARAMAVDGAEVTTGGGGRAPLTLRTRSGEERRSAEAFHRADLARDAADGGAAPPLEAGVLVRHALAEPEGRSALSAVDLEGATRWTFDARDLGGWETPGAFRTEIRAVARADDALLVVVEDRERGGERSRASVVALDASDGARRWVRRPCPEPEVH